jgi:hypothetical protein
MNIDVTGIKNENEFYYEHYFSSMLGDGLKPIFDSWGEESTEGPKPPNKQLEGFRKDFLKIKARLEKAKKISQVLEEWRPGLIQLLQILDYNFNPSVLKLGSNIQVPLIARVDRSDGNPELIIIEALSTEKDYYDGLKCSVHGEQYPEGYEEINIPEKCIEDLLSLALFDGPQPPRWALVISKSEVILIDRSKWSEKRLMRFDLDEILGRKEPSTIKATAALLHRNQLVPVNGVSFLDSLDENSHKHAHGVSEDLKFSLREAIELIGQEAVYYYKDIRKEKVFDKGDQMAEQLSLECLRYMYRLLFLFYIESRPELGYAPMNSQTYRKGYSLEALRDLELVRLTTPESQDGTTIHEWIERLFSLVYNGEGWESQTMGMVEEGSRYYTFAMPPLKTHLFDPKRTPILEKVKFRNKILRQVIELMSLSRETGRRQSKRGRVSYSELGINQLGAVYETLLSFRGFFAEEDLYEVKEAGTNPTLLDPAYFVSKDELDKYDESEIVFNRDGTFKIYPKGTFVYRLSGRDREKSASYYTPEVLTQCLVKYALKELLKDKTADEILKLTICEPAMGSAAFLNEAVNQLAEAYLTKKQNELGENIPHDKYLSEKQKVKMYLADNNVYGVDLNPVAVELAQVSLWLNTIHEGGFVPWFGMQLISGNSLIGARKQIFDSDMLRANPAKGKVWLKETPERVRAGKERPEYGIYHFLIPNEGMANYTDEVVKKLVPNEIRRINEWRKEFLKPFTEEEISQLKRFSEEIDNLWQWHTRKLDEIKLRTTDFIDFFGRTDFNSAGYSPQPTSTALKDKIVDEVLHSRGMKNSSPYRRLKFVMDYWCSLWFWPIQKADELPTRSELFMDLSMILLGNVFESRIEDGSQKPLFSDVLSTEEIAQLRDNFGLIDLDRLIERFSRLKVVERVAAEHRFLHWELEFADVFRRRGGFDLVLGNPPWKRVEWRENDVISDENPLAVIRVLKVKEVDEIRSQFFDNEVLRSKYLNEYETLAGNQEFFGNESNFPILSGVSVNLYKIFLPHGWYLNCDSGLCAYLHPEGVFDDPNGGRLREELYLRLKYHFQFENEARLFQEIAPVNVYSINIYGEPKPEITFDTISNCYHPKTVDGCYKFSENSRVPGIKSDENKLEFEGHPLRIVNVTSDKLAVYAKVFDEAGVSALQARLPRVHSMFAYSIIEKIAKFPTRLEDFRTNYIPTVMFIEKEAIKKKLLREETEFPPNLSEMVWNGPHFHVANPYFKTPKAICRQKEHYSVIDHESLSESYIARTNYFPENHNNIQHFLPSFEGSEKTIIDYYSVAFRKMISPVWERTLLSCIKPPKVLHVDSVFSITFRDEQDAVLFSGLCSSLIYDFIVKTSGKTNFRNDLASILPFPQKVFPELICRTLALNCLTSSYKSLWEKCFLKEFRLDSWTRKDARLKNGFFTNLSAEWSNEVSLRDDYSRRQALIEIDVLTAMILGISLEELIEIYNQVFYGLKNVEKNTFYDQKGRIVFIKRKGFEAVGLPKKSNKAKNVIGWEEVKELKEGFIEQVVLDDTNPGKPVGRRITYEAPFHNCNRELDYTETWKEFERRFEVKGPF